MSTVPVPVHFKIPTPDWRIASDEDRDAAGASFLALRPGLPGDFVANITVTGELRTDGAPLETVADEALAQLSDDAELLERKIGGQEKTPAVTQLAHLTATIDGVHLDLQQMQVLLGIEDEGGRTEEYLVYLLALTALTEQMPAVVPDFQEFVRSFRIGSLGGPPDGGPAASDPGGPGPNGDGPGETFA